MNTYKDPSEEPKGYQRLLVHKYYSNPLDDPQMRSFRSGTCDRQIWHGIRFRQESLEIFISAMSEVEKGFYCLATGRGEEEYSIIRRSRNVQMEHVRFMIFRRPHLGGSDVLNG